MTIYREEIKMWKDLNSTKDCEYSVILPVYNEETCLKEILNRIHRMLTGLGQSFEIICVDDGSTDRTWAILEEFYVQKPYIKALRFSRNFGHQAAIYAGIKYCCGSYVAVLDADGQDPPEVLPTFFEKCRQGYDVVYAVRKKRKENIFKRAAYKIFYRFYRRVAPFEVPLDSGDFAVFSKDVAQFIQTLSEKNPFIRGLRSWHGGKQCGIEYERQKRASGQVKYSFYKLLQLAINSTVSFSKMPLRTISLLGAVISLLSFLYGFLTILRKIIIGINLPGWTSIAVLITFFGGLNLFTLGVIGEYIGQIFDEVKDRPAFLVYETLGLEEKNNGSSANGVRQNRIAD